MFCYNFIYHLFVPNVLCSRATGSHSCSSYKQWDWSCYWLHGSQSAGGLVKPSHKCQYFLSGPWLPNQPQSISNLWRMTNYTAWKQSYMCVCEQLAQSHYIIVKWLAVEPATSQLPVQCPNTEVGKLFSIPTHVVNTCTKFHQNPSSKSRKTGACIKICS